VKFLADENIDKNIVAQLRKDGHIVFYIPEMEPSISDNEIIKISNNEQTLLITSDKDFGELLFRQGFFINGVLLLRLYGLSKEIKAKIVSRAILKHSTELLHNFTVINPGMVRIRKTRNTN